MFESHFDPISDDTKQELLGLAKVTKPIYDVGDVGLIYLDSKRMEEIFTPYIKKYFNKDVTFHRAWIHWMRDGGNRNRHQHSHWTYLYYLDIPEGDAGSLIVEGITVKPIQGTHIMFPKKTYHSITPNNSKQTRWAFAAECVI
ncbi:hypothetical protein LCGC14_1480660 [marine sediment metagenome]|uniref:Prolyl 4-hydroxylase alpha subunit Fe(2+) 2OG dioxygenase domain-containing protein n=1 Tax=marine sediment metagenome TaxID=412755 RepID=A0A0F9JVK3_9ZZZZ